MGRLPRVQGRREGSSALSGQQRVKVSEDYQCTVAGRRQFFVAVVCRLLKQAHCSRASIAFARSLGRAACCFRDEQLGWASMSTNRPTALFLSMCMMDGLVSAQEDSKCLRVA